MSVFLIDKPIRQFVNQVSDEQYAMTPTVIAASAAQAAALGEACMQISLDQQVDTLDWQEVTTRIGQMAHFKETLLEWCNQELYAPNGPVAEPGGGSRPQVIFDYALEVGRLSAQAARMLQDFRPLAHKKVADDLEMSLNLLSATARTALLLLQSHLQRRPEPALVQTYEPARLELEQQLGSLVPVSRIDAHG